MPCLCLIVCLKVFSKSFSIRFVNLIVYFKVFYKLFPIRFVNLIVYLKVFYKLFHFLQFILTTSAMYPQTYGKGIYNVIFMAVIAMLYKLATQDVLWSLPYIYNNGSLNYIYIYIIFLGRHSI